jgi:hypothetical protein
MFALLKPSFARSGTVLEVCQWEDRCLKSRFALCGYLRPIEIVVGRLPEATLSQVL